MGKKWCEMSENEREVYISQDYVRRHWREMLECEIGTDLFQDLADVSSVSGLYRSGPGDVDGLLEKILPPQQAIYLMQYHINGKSVKEIAKAVEIQYQIDEMVFTKKGVKPHVVYKELQRAKSRLVETMQKGTKVQKSLPIERDVFYPPL